MTGLASLQRRLGKFLNALSPLQKRMLATVVVLVVVGAMTLIVGLVTPSYGVLLANLNYRNADRVMDRLSQMGIEYHIDATGKKILIPENKVHEIRQQLAGEGLLSSDAAWYESPDPSSPSVSDFAGWANHQRALEGELAQTILHIHDVEYARVHLVVAESSDTHMPTPTASVVVRLREGSRLEPATIAGIRHLVAGSVRGLHPDNVSILDTHGVLVSDTTRNVKTATGAEQHRIRKEVESYLAGKVRNILGGVVGADNVLVQVNADIDFRRIETTIEDYNPDRAVIRSEKVHGDASGKHGSLSGGQTTTDYEISKKVEHVIDGDGNIKRLTVAVLVSTSGPASVNNGGAHALEMSKLTDIVKKTIGFDESRKDEVSVVGMPFPATMSVTAVGDGLDQESHLLKKLLLVLAMVSAVLLLRSLTHDVLGTFAPGTLAWISGRKQSTPHRGWMNTGRPHNNDGAQPWVMVRDERKREVESFLREKPLEGALLLKVWLSDRDEF